jgi:c-di-GMP-binding flagellar brake protein YcgR
MPELIRSAVSRVHLYFKDRRQSPRLRTRLVFTVSIHVPTNGNGNGRIRPTPSLKGHTRDISADGMGLLLPQIHLNGHHLSADGSELEVRLEFGAEPAIRILVVPRRYERLEDTELGCAYLIGARIVTLDEADRLRYLSLISEGLQASRENLAHNY